MFRTIAVIRAPVEVELIQDIFIRQASLQQFDWLARVVELNWNIRHLSLHNYVLYVTFFYSVNLIAVNIGPLMISLTEENIIWQDLRSLSFTFVSVCLSVCDCVCLSALCTPQFWSHKLVDPYLLSWNWIVSWNYVRITIVYKMKQLLI